MKKRITKSIAVLFFVLFLFSLFVPSGYAASYIVDGDWKFEMTVSNDSYYVAEYLGNDTSVTIPSLYNEKPVVKVNPYAFLNNSSILYVNFPATVTEIGESAFYGCTGLKTLRITQYVDKIGSGAFYGCSSLTSVTIDAGTQLKSIPAHTFNSCTKLASVALPHGIESIGEYAFNNCEKLTSVIVPGSVTSIENTSFYKSENLTVYGWSGTYAEAYTTEMNIPFYSFGEYVEPTTAAPTTVAATTAAPTTVAPTTVFTDPVETTKPVETTVPFETDPKETTAPITTVPFESDPKESTAPITTAPAESSTVVETTPAETTAPQPTTLPEASVPTTTELPVETVTLYFSNNEHWDQVNYYYWTTDGENAPWSGVPATFVRTNVYGQDIYSVTVPKNILGIIFNNGLDGDNSEQTVNIGSEIEFADNLGFYLTDKNESGMWLYETFIYSDIDPTESTTAVSTDIDTTASQATAVTTTGDPLVTENSFPTIPVHTLPSFTDTDETYPVLTTVTETKPGTEYIIGDSDLDGKISVKDATLIQKFVAEMELLSNIQKFLSNVDSTGGITVKDATAIQKYVAQMPTDTLVGNVVYI